MARGARANKTGRSKGGQYFGLGYEMAKSAAFRSLSGAAMKIFIELRCRYNGSNNGDLSLSMGEAAGLLHISKSTAQRAFAELQEKGFILRTSEGHWYGRKAATYAVTSEKIDTPVKETQKRNTWKNWRPEPTHKTRKKIKRGTLEGLNLGSCIKRIPQVEN